MGFGFIFCSFDKYTDKYFYLYILPCFHPKEIKYNNYYYYYHYYYFN